METENYQFVPVLCIGALFLANVLRKRSVLCVSSLLLLYTLLSMVGSWFVFFEPRTGDPYSSLEAMTYFSLNYGILCVPLLFYRDRGESGPSPLGGCPAPVQSLMKALACITVPATVYFLFDSGSELISFITSGIDRESFRAGLSLGRMGSLAVLLLNVFSSLSFVSLWFAVYGMFSGAGKGLVCLLYVGGAGAAISMLKNVARSGVMEMIFFCIATGLALWRYVPRARKAKILRVAACVLVVISLPFWALTIARFARPDSAESPFHSVWTYFSTGPYSFNVNYEVIVNMDAPTLYGSQTFFAIPMLGDFLHGTSLYEDGVSLYEELHEPGFPEYNEVSGAYSGEFRTIVGAFLFDWSPFAATAICFLICILTIWCFVAGKEVFSSSIITSIYFYLLFDGIMMYGFSGRYRTMLLFALLLTAAGFAVANRKNRLFRDLPGDSKEALA